MLAGLYRLVLFCKVNKFVESSGTMPLFYPSYATRMSLFLFILSFVAEFLC